MRSNIWSTGAPALIIITFAGAVPGANKLREIRVADNLLPVVCVHETRHPLRFKVPDRDALPVIFNIQRKILPHHPKADHTELRKLSHGSC